MSRAAMQQALEALVTCCAEEWRTLNNFGMKQVYDEKKVNAAVAALRAALAEPEPQPQRVHPLDTPLEVFVANLSTRPRNIINAEMMYFTHSGDEFMKPPFTVRHLMMFSRKELRAWPNLGKRSLNEIEEGLRNLGLQLWEKHDERSLKLLREHPTYYTAPTPQPKPQTTHWEGCEAVHPECRKPEQEPDYYGLTADHLWMSISKDHYDRLKPEYRMTCYTAPTPRKWVGLTDEEISEVLGSDIHDEPSGELRFIRAIEAKLKEKNT